MNIQNNSDKSYLHTYRQTDRHIYVHICIFVVHFPCQHELSFVELALNADLGAPQGGAPHYIIIRPAKIPPPFYYGHPSNHAFYGFRMG